MCPKPEDITYNKLLKRVKEFPLFESIGPFKLTGSTIAGLMDLQTMLEDESGCAVKFTGNEPNINNFCIEVVGVVHD